MSQPLWLSVSPALNRFDQRLIRHLAQRGGLRHWAYNQTPDEPCNIQIAVLLLHDFLKQQAQPVNLVGHGLSGLVGLIYAQEYPERVRSLALLSVGSHPGVTWHAHYYALRNVLPCSRSQVLAQMAHLLFGYQGASYTAALGNVLQQDLDASLTLHSLVNRPTLPLSMTTSVPLFVGQGAQDGMVDPPQQYPWQDVLKSGDRHWVCPGGRHFFHHTYPQLVATALSQFWQQLAPVPVSRSLVQPSF